MKCALFIPLGKPIDQQKTLSVKKKKTHDSSKSYITYEVVPSIHIHSTCIYMTVKFPELSWLLYQLITAALRQVYDGRRDGYGCVKHVAIQFNSRVYFLMSPHHACLLGAIMPF